MTALDARVRTWRRALRIVAGFNLLLWLLVTAREPGLQRWLSGVFTAVCAYRSFFPVAYVKRWCFGRSWTSSAFVTRTLATIAELCFAGQLHLVMQHWSDDAGIPCVGIAGWAVVAAVSTAQISCWYGVATRRYVGEMIEESLWAVGMLVLLAASLTTGVSHGFSLGVVLCL